MKMDSITEILNKVWAHFRSKGIADDLVVIEYLAAILTADLKFPETLQPRKPATTIDLDYVKKLLKESSGLAEGDEKLFNRHIIMRLSDMLPGGRYPTPRHIVNFMYQIVQVEKSSRLGDLACGSGGFLVRPEWTDLKNLIGTEISSEWARIAYANCLLHGFLNVKIEIGNSLALFSKNGPLAEEMFDRILMNPSFGEKLDVKLAEELLGPETGSRSETVLTHLALKKLAFNGRAGILVPSGLLFTGSNAEKGLRRRLIDDYQLEAVISFPKDAFQPFSQLQTQLVLAQKSSPTKDSITWFLRAEKDGYPSGRSRDLTKEPDLPSDLPLIIAALNSRQKGWDARFPEEGDVIGIKRLTNQKGEVIGVIVGMISDGTISAVEIFPEVVDGPLILFVAKKDTGRQTWIRVKPALGEATLISNYKEYLSEVTGKKKVEDLPRQRLSFETSSTRQILFDHNNRYLGCSVLQTMVEALVYDLRPESYVKALEEERAPQSPAKLLVEIRQSQKKLLNIIDGLLGRLDMSPIAKAKIPPNVWTEGGESLKPFEGLSEEQQMVWKSICRKTASYPEEGEEYETPVYFTAKDVEPLQGKEASLDTQSVMELFEKMGLIVKVNIGSLESKDRIECYRLVSERDRWVLGDDQSDERSQEDGN